MKQFITPFAVHGTIEELQRIEKLLLESGYYRNDRYNELVKYIASGSSHTPNNELCLYSILSSIRRQIIPYSKENEGLILALAAMTEGVKVYPGEYIVMVGDYSRILKIGNIYKVLKFQDECKQNYEEQDDNTFFTLEHDNNQGIAGYLSPPRRDFRKATKDEIYNHFKSKNMPEIKDENGGTNRIMTSYSNIESKKEIIGWDVKPGIDRTAALKIIGWEKNIRGNLGTITVEIKHNGQAYQDALKLGVLGALFVPIYEEDIKTIIIGANTYNIYNDYIIYKYNTISYKFTKSDLQQLIDVYGSRFSIAAVSYTIEFLRFGCENQIRVTLDDIRNLISYLK